MATPPRVVVHETHVGHILGPLAPEVRALGRADPEAKELGILAHVVVGHLDGDSLGRLPGSESDGTRSTGVVLVLGGPGQALPGCEQVQKPCLASGVVHGYIPRALTHKRQRECDRILCILGNVAHLSGGARHAYHWLRVVVSDGACGCQGCRTAVQRCHVVVVGQLQGKGLVGRFINLVVNDGYANGGAALACRDVEYLVGLAGFHLPGVVRSGYGCAVHGGVPDQDGSRAQDWPDGYRELDVAVGLGGLPAFQVYESLGGVCDVHRDVRRRHAAVIASRNLMGDKVCRGRAAGYPVIQGHNRYRLRRGPVRGGESEGVGHEPEEATLIAGQGDDHRVCGLGIQDQGVGLRLSAFYQGKADRGCSLVKRLCPWCHRR